MFRIRLREFHTYRDVETAACIMPPAPSAVADGETCATVVTTPPVGLGRAATSSMGLRLS